MTPATRSNPPPRFRAERSTWGRNRRTCWPSTYETGKLRWKYRATDSIGESSPAVYEGIVYMGDLGGILHAVNAANGKALWTFKTEAEISSSPVIAGDQLLIGSYDGNLYCLSRRDGKLVWKFTTGSYVHGTPAIAGGVAYVSGCDEVFHGIRLADGQEVVQIPRGRPGRRFSGDARRLGLVRQFQ